MLYKIYKNKKLLLEYQIVMYNHTRTILSWKSQSWSEGGGGGFVVVVQSLFTTLVISQPHSSNIMSSSTKSVRSLAACAHAHYMEGITSIHSIQRGLLRRCKAL